MSGKSVKERASGAGGSQVSKVPFRKTIISVFGVFNLLLLVMLVVAFMNQLPFVLKFSLSVLLVASFVVLVAWYFWGRRRDEFTKVFVSELSLPFVGVFLPPLVYATVRLVGKCSFDEGPCRIVVSFGQFMREYLGVSEEVAMAALASLYFAGAIKVAYLAYASAKEEKR